MGSVVAVVGVIVVVVVVASARNTSVAAETSCAACAGTELAHIAVALASHSIGRTSQRIRRLRYPLWAATEALGGARAPRCVRQGTFAFRMFSFYSCAFVPAPRQNVVLP